MEFTFKKTIKIPPTTKHTSKKFNSLEEILADKNMQNAFDRNPQLKEQLIASFKNIKPGDIRKFETRFGSNTKSNLTEDPTTGLLVERITQENYEGEKKPTFEEIPLPDLKLTKKDKDTINLIKINMTRHGFIGATCAGTSLFLLITNLLPTFEAITQIIAGIFATISLTQIAYALSYKITISKTIENSKIKAINKKIGFDESMFNKTHSSLSTILMNRTLLGALGAIIFVIPAILMIISPAFANIQLTNITQIAYNLNYSISTISSLILLLLGIGILFKQENTS